MDRQRTTVCVNQRVVLMQLARELKVNLLHDLDDAQSSLRLRFGGEMCGLWAMMVSECEIKWNNNFTSKAGRCRTWKIDPRTGIKRPSEVELSWPYFRDYHPTNTVEFAETVLHEIAHVMTPGSRHGLLWVTVAKAIGSNGKRCHSLLPPRNRGPRDCLLDKANALAEKIRLLEEE